MKLVRCEWGLWCRALWCPLAVHIPKALRGGRRWAKQWGIILSAVRTSQFVVPFSWLKQQWWLSLSRNVGIIVQNSGFCFPPGKSQLCSLKKTCWQILWLLRFCHDFFSAVCSVTVKTVSAFLTMKHRQNRQHNCSQHSIVTCLKRKLLYREWKL